MSIVSENDDIESIAARWVMRADRGALTHEEQRDLDAWLESDARHRGAFVRAQAIWMDLDRVIALKIGDKPPLAAPPQRWQGLRAASLAVACLGLLLATALIAQVYLAGRETTAHGEIRRMTLEDGSTIVLNTSSVVNVRYTQHERRILLREGEASFDVTHDAARPFIVQARDVAVRAVGTNFSVRLRSADSRTSAAGAHGSRPM